MKASRTIPLLAAAAFAFVLVMMPISSVSASSDTVPNGWTIQSGEGYELYITPYVDLNASELVLFVNYSAENMILRVDHESVAISSKTISPGTSSFLQLEFPDDGAYQILIYNSGGLLLTLNKQRTAPLPGTDPEVPPWDDDDWNIVPPGTSPWKPVVPGTTDPLIYTQAAVDALLAALTAEVLMITAALMAAAMVLGAVVQRTVRFIWPTDFVTVTIVAFMLTQLFRWPAFVVIPGIDNMWWIPIIIGYFIGYIVIGRTRYVMVRRITDDKAFETVPWVLYNIDGKPHIQEQNNKALIKRLFFGIHHPILSPLALDPDYDDKTKYPGFPVFERKMVCVESWRTYEMMDAEGKSRIIKLKRYATEVKLAYGSAVSKYELLRNLSALDKANSRIVEAENTIHALNQSISVRMADTVASFLAKVYSRAPGAVFKDAVDRWNSKKEEDSKKAEDKDVQKG